LRYLADAEFGLWVLVMQVVAFVALVDFGITGATARILIDYKDQAEEFGSLLRTTIIVNLAQAALALVVGSIAALLLGSVLNVPANLQTSFKYLLLWQSVLAAISFAVRIFGQALIAHQRTDVANYVQIGAFVINFAVLWVSFQFGAGIYSVVVGQAAAFIATTCAYAVACSKLRLLPRIKRWAPLDRAKLRELLSLGSDVFVFALGSQLVNASQIVIISRTLGLEAAAVWSICTRSFNLMGQFVGRALDFAAPALSEMFVRGERERFFERLRAVTVLSQSLAIAAAAIFVSCNQPFVSLWAGAQFTWPVTNDLLLGIWFILITAQRCYVGSLTLRKQLKAIKYVYLAEGAVFILSGLLAVRLAGLTGIILCSIFSTVTFTMAYGISKTRAFFELSYQELLRDWFLPSLRLLAFAAALSVSVVLLTTNLVEPMKLFLRAFVLSIVLPIGFLRFSLRPEMQAEIIAKSPPFMRRALVLVSRPLRQPGSGAKAAHTHG
jgi:O-antigen/teichoic acid export membrane protein